MIEAAAAKLRARADSYSRDAMAARRIEAWNEAAILARLADELRACADDIEATR